jgi:mitotic-spindle organizing protein 1
LNKIGIQTGFYIGDMPQREVREGRENEIESMYKLSEILNCQLDRRTLSILLELIEAGVHPEALADIVLEARSPVIHSSSSIN